MYRLTVSRPTGRNFLACVAVYETGREDPVKIVALAAAPDMNEAVDTVRWKAAREFEGQDNPTDPYALTVEALWKETV